MGRKIMLPGVSFTDTTLPVLPTYDAIESPGSLFLFEPANPLGLVTGVPGVGASLPNVVWPLAAARLGSGTASSLAGTVTASDANSALWQVERTSKGGLHGIVTQGGSQAAQLAWIAALPAAIRDYIRANLPGRSFYFSSWRRVTRATLANAAPQSHFHCAGNTTNYIFLTQSGVFNPQGGAQSLGFSRLPAGGVDDTVSPDGVTNRFTSGAISDVTGTGVSAGQAVEFGLGTFGAWNTFNHNRGPSHVLYRIYVEDLTASGRTYAQVNALDQALFNAAFGAGGRYAGDTFTNPSTIP